MPTFRTLLIALTLIVATATAELDAQRVRLFWFRRPAASTNPIVAARMPSGSTTLPEAVWSLTGAPEITDTRSTACFSVSPGVSLTTLNNDLANCTAGQYVSMAAGSYSFAGSIVLKSHVTLRGAGPNSTLITVTAGTCAPWGAAVCFAGSTSHYFGNIENSTAWQGGYTKGTATIQLDTNPNLAVGHVIHLDELSDTCTSAGSDLWPEMWRSTIGPYCSEGSGEQNGGGVRDGRAHIQEVKVTSVEAGTCGSTGNGTCDIGISPPLISTYSSGKTPQAIWANTVGSGAGLEDLSIAMGGCCNKGLDMTNTVGSWAKHVRLNHAVRDFVLLQNSVFATVRDSYFFRSDDHQSTSYGVEMLGGSFNRIENNIFHWISAPVIVNGGVGNVISYNYMVNDEFFPTYMAAGGWGHNGGTESNLWEGNDMPGVHFDPSHGPTSLFTVFRNYFWGREISATNDTNGAKVDSFSRFDSFLGNVMGLTGYHTLYQCDHAATCADDNSAIWQFAGGAVLSPDPRVEDSVFRWGNWDVVTSTSDNTSGDQTGTRWNSGEVPSAIGGSYQQTVPSSQTLPTSMYLSSKPSFMLAGDPWPFYGPDVTHASPIANTGGHAARNPAGRCYVTTMGGTPTGTTVLPFTCTY